MRAKETDAIESDLSEKRRRKLAAGVLNQAARDLRRFHGGRSKLERELYDDAYFWFMSEDSSWPFSFPNVCRILNRAPEEVRKKLVGDVAIGPLGRWVRRCGRALRQFLHAPTEPAGLDYGMHMPVPARLAQTWY